MAEDRPHLPADPPPTRPPRSEDALRDQAELLRTLGDNLPDGFIYQVMATPDGGRRFTYLSAGVERVLGVPRAEALADAGALYGLIHPDDAPGVAAAEAESLAGTRPFDREFRARTRSGEERWVHCRSAPQRLADGTVVWDGFLTDVSAPKRAEAALRESEYRFRTLFESMDEGYCVIEVRFDEADRPIDYRFLEVNPAFEKQTGIRDAPGRWMRSIAPGHEQHWFDIYGRIAKTGETLRFENAATALGRYYDVCAFRIGPPEARQVGIVFNDITERRQTGAALRESEARFRQLAESIPQLAWVARPDGHIFWYNRRWYEYTGTTAAEMAGWGWQAVHDPAVLPAVLDRWKRSLATGEPFDMVFPLRGADGQFRPFLTRVMPLKDEAGRVVQWFGTNTDVSEHKRAEAALREEARRKDQFIAMLAHELRNPLAPIGNAMHLLARSRDQAVVDKVQDIVTRQVTHLSRVVDDLLELSRVARGQVELRRERVDLGRKARQAAGDLAGAFDKAGVRLEVNVPETPVWVEGDRTRLTQVVANLLANAVKFTDRGGRAAVRVRTDGGQAVLTVTDTGVGMTPETVARLFEPFGQADQSLARTRGGLGLGLALVKGFVELHGGTVTAASAGPGRGSEFTVRLPRVGEPPALTAAPRPAARPAARKRVLIVEDNRDSADSLRMVFELIGYDVTVAYTGPDGAEAAKRVRPDLVICDIGLPGMDGYAVARRIRAELGPEQPVLVALTGYGEAADRDKALAAGFDRHFTKPADPAALEAALTSRP